jgi:hypothetical protein
MNSMGIVRWIAGCIILSTLTGCMTYRYAGDTFSSESDAAKAQARAHEQALASIQPTKNRVGGAARFCVPNKERIYAGTIGGNMGREYVTKMLLNDIRFLHAALVKRNIFDQVTYVETQGEACLWQSGEMATVYFLMSADNKAGGYYFSSQAVLKEPVQYDSGATKLSDKVLHLLNSVEALAHIKPSR